MWETFITRQYHNSGELVKLGEFTSPWPCFMIATTTRTIAARHGDLEAMLAAVRDGCQYFRDHKSDMVARVAAEFSLSTAEATAWYDGVRITGSQQVRY